MAENVIAFRPIVQQNQLQYMPLGIVKRAKFREPHILGRFSTPVLILKFSPDGKHLASVHNGSNVSVWDIEKRNLRHSFNDKSDITTMSWSHDSSIILTGNTRKELSLWDRARGKVKSQLRGNISCLTCSDFNSISTLVVSGSTDGTTMIYDVRSGLPMNTYPFHAAVRSVSFSPGNSCFVASLDDGTAFIVDAVSNERPTELPSTNDLPITSIKFCPTHRHIMTTCLSESRISDWNIINAKLIKLTSNNENIPPADVYYHDKPWGFSGSQDDVIHSWNFPDASIVPTWNQNSGPLLNVDIHPTKEIIAAGVSGHNPSVKIWQHGN